MEKKKIAIVLVGFALIVVFLLLRNRSEINVPSASEEAAQEAEIRIISPGEAKPNAEQAARYQQLVKWEKEERKLDLKRMPLRIVNGEAILNVEVVTKGTCFPGDANAIEMDLKASPDNRLLITLEELSGKEKPISWQLPKDFLTQGSAKHEFKVSIADEPTQYGFFLCTARSSDTRCGDKPVKDINEIFTEHLRKDENAGKETRNIFFQYFFVDTRGISAFSGFQKHDHKFENLKNYVKDRKIKNPNFEKEIDIAKKNMKTLMSYPFSFDGKNMKVELPQYNVAACAGGK